MNVVIPVNSFRTIHFRTGSSIICAAYQTKSVTARIPLPTAIRQLSSSSQKSNKTPPVSPPSSSDKPPSTGGAKTPLPKAEIERPDYTPVQLSRPVGLEFPPEPGQNTGDDKRTLQEKRDDFVNWDKHLAKRRMLLVTLALSVGIHTEYAH